MADDDIKVRIAGDLADINRSLRELNSRTRDSGKAAKDAQGGFAGFGRQLDGLKKQVAGVAAAYLSFRGITSLVGAAVRATVAQEQAVAQLDAALISTGGAIGITREELLKLATDLQRVSTFGDEAIISAQTRLLSYTGIVGSQFPRALRAVLDQSARLNISLEQSAETIGRALESPMKAAAALAQQGFGAAFTSSVREAIRSLVETGRTAEAQAMILEILEDSYGGAAKAARDTFGGALAALKNVAGDLLEADDGLPGVTDSINELTATLQDPNTRAALQVLANGILGLAGLTADATAEFARLQRQFDLNSRSVLGTVTEVERLEQGLLDVERALDGKLMTTPLRFLFTSREELEQLQKDLTFFLETARNGGSGIIQRPDVAPEASPAPTADARIDLRTLQADLNAAGVILQDELKRLREGLDRELEAGLKTYSEYFQQRASLETQQIDQTLAQRRNALALLDEEIRLLEERGETTEKQEAQRKQATAEILVLERQRGDIAGKAARDQAKAERELAEQLRAVEIRLQAASGDSVGARNAELAREFEGLIQRLVAEGDVAGIELVQRLINVEQAKAQLDRLQADYQAAIAEMARAEQSIQAQVATGAISEYEGRRQIIALHRDTAQTVRGLIPIMRELAEASGDPAAIERIKDMETALDDLAARAASASNQMRAGIQDSAEDAFASFLDGTKKAKDAFRDFARDVISQMARIASQQIIGQLFSGFAGTAHTGGIAGETATRRKISPVTFAGAPRLHSGGIAGLRPGEVPAILMRGEEVLTEDDPRHRRNLGGDGITINVDASGSQDPAGIWAAAEAFKAQVKAEMAHETRRRIR